MDVNKEFRSLRELEPDNIERQLINTSQALGIDISALMQVMVPPQVCAEEDEVWDYNLVFQEVASYVNTLGKGGDPAAEEVNSRG